MATSLRLEFHVKPIFSWMTELSESPLSAEQLREVEDVFVTYFRERLEDRFPDVSLVIRYGVGEFPLDIETVRTHSEGTGPMSYEPYAVVAQVSHTADTSKEDRDRADRAVARAVEDQFPRIYDEDYVLVRNICMKYAAIHSPIIRKLLEIVDQAPTLEDDEISS